MWGISNAYTLTVRQGPERGKAFSGPKEKDRKPVDPPPIIQLHINDPSDPASNYLQSPYFFMCCNLCDADLSRPGQLSAALQGEDSDTASQAALAGTLVSSLHRLKDVDNTDGGFFVFPDISVRLEGQFRLRFSLFEMLKTAPKVIYIKSVHTEPFTVYTPRGFPGMSESTFLSRSFGDQGVKLRIRKEPRTLGKRTAPTDTPTSETPQPPPPQPQPYNPQRANYAGMGIQPQQSSQTTEYGSEGREAAAGYDEPPSKRQRSGIDFLRRATYMEEERPIQRSFTQQRDPFSQYREPTPSQRQSYYPQQPTSAQSSEFSLPGHQRNLSSSASSTFESPRAEYPAYSYPSQTSIYQQPRDANFQYSYRPPLQMQQPVPPERQLPSSIPSQQLGSYNRLEESSHQQQQQQQPQQPYTELSYPRQIQPYQGQQSTYPSTQQPLPRTLPPPTQPGSATTLPPLGSNVQPSQYATTNGTGSDTYATASGNQAYQNYSYRGRDG